MKRLQINFAQRRPLPRPRAWLMLCSCVLAAATAFWQYLAAADDVDRLANQVAAARQAHQAARPVAATRALPERSISAINQAIARLNLPWDAFFSVFEAERSSAIALLTLEPNGLQSIRAMVEAKTSSDMTDYVSALSSEKHLTTITLVKHEINEQDPNRPLRFIVEARWGAGQ